MNDMRKWMDIVENTITEKKDAFPHDRINGFDFDMVMIRDDYTSSWTGRDSGYVSKSWQVGDTGYELHTTRYDRAVRGDNNKATAYVKKDGRQMNSGYFRGPSTKQFGNAVKQAQKFILNDIRNNADHASASDAVDLGMMHIVEYDDNHRIRSYLNLDRNDHAADIRSIKSIIRQAVQKGITVSGHDWDGFSNDMQAYHIRMNDAAIVFFLSLNSDYGKVYVDDGNDGFYYGGKRLKFCYQMNDLLRSSGVSLVKKDKSNRIRGRR